MATKSQQLRQSFLASGAGAAVLLVALVAWFTGNRAEHILEQQADARGRDVAARQAALVTHYLNERRREVVSLASMPQLIAAVRQAGQDAAARGLDRIDIPTLERMFAGSRQLGGDPGLRDYLRAYTTISDFAEMFVTESHGFNVLTSGPTSDFVQRDEAWWQRAVEDGVYEGDAKFDSSAAAVTLEFDVAIRAPGVARPAGVLKAVFALDRLAKLLGSDELTGGAYLEVVDNGGRVLVSRDPMLLLQPLPDKDRIPLAAGAASARVATTREGGGGRGAGRHGTHEPRRVVGPVPPAHRHGVRRRPEHAAQRVARRPARRRARGRGPVLAVAPAQPARDGAREGRGGHREPRGGRRPVGDGVHTPRRGRGGGRPAVVGPLDGRGAAAPGRGDPLRGR